MMTLLPDATLYGLANRTTDADISFTNLGETLRELFVNGTPIIGICAAPRWSLSVYATPVSSGGLMIVL